MKKIIIFLMCVVALTSCSKDVFRRSHTIRFRVNAAATKSVAMTTNGLKSEGHFVVDVFVDDPWNDYDTYPDDTPDSPRYGNTAAERHYVESSGAYNVKYGSADWYIEDSNGKEAYTWIGNDVMRFWCYWPDDASVDVASEGIRSITLPSAADKASSMSFTYVLPTADDLSGEVNDAAHQKDLLFAYTDRNYKKDEDDGIDINFNHPLSEVRFCVSQEDGTFDINLQIKRIELLNVVKGGTCIFNGKGSIAGGTMFEWTPSTTFASYAQDYYAVFNNPHDPTVVSGWTRTGYPKEAPTSYVQTCNTAFMMIPQTTHYDPDDSKKAAIRVTFGNTGTGSDITRTAYICGDGTTSHPADVWKPGYYYNYKIGATTIDRSISMIVVLDEWGNFDDKLIVK